MGFTEQDIRTLLILFSNQRHEFYKPCFWINGTVSLFEFVGSYSPHVPFSRKVGEWRKVFTVNTMDAFILEYTNTLFEADKDTHIENILNDITEWINDHSFDINNVSEYLAANDNFQNLALKGNKVYEKTYCHMSRSYSDIVFEDAFVFSFDDFEDFKGELAVYDFTRFEGDYIEEEKERVFNLEIRPYL